MVYLRKKNCNEDLMGHIDISYHVAMHVEGTHTLLNSLL